MLASVGLLVFGFDVKGGENFREWAKKEALAREKVIENGGEIEFGKYYSKSEFEPAEDLDGMPTDKEQG